MHLVDLNAKECRQVATIPYAWRHNATVFSSKDIMIIDDDGRATRLSFEQDCFGKAEQAVKINVKKQFLATRALWLIISNSDYSKKCEITGQQAWIDLDDTRNNAVAVKQGFIQMGAKPEEIVILQDATLEQLN